MARFQSTVLTTLLLGAFLGTPVPALAHGGGGGHGGGGHGGGFHGGHYGGYHHYGYGGYGFGYGGFYPGYGYGFGYPGYGYGFGGFYPAYGGVNPIYLNAAVTPAVAGGVPIILPPVGPGQFPDPPPQPTDNKAHIRVILPANAVLWFGGEATAQTGAQRDFVSPELPQDKTYTYEIKARWMQGGQPVERTLQVKVRRNQASVADFNQIPPPKD